MSKDKHPAWTPSPAPSVHAERSEHYRKVRSLDLAQAKRIDPEGVAAYLAQLTYAQAKSI